MTVAQEVAKQLSDHLYVVGSKINDKANRTGHARLIAYVGDVFELSRAFKEIADGKVEDYVKAEVDGVVIEYNPDSVPKQ